MLNVPRPDSAEGDTLRPVEQKAASRPPAVSPEVTVESASRLGEELITRWVGSGGEPTIPGGRRDEIVATLTRCMVSEAVREAYTGSLQAGWRAHRDREPMAGRGLNDVPVIYKSGFAPLSDAVLADIAVCPSAVTALWLDVTTPSSHEQDNWEVGKWLDDEMHAAYGLKKS